MRQATLEAALPSVGPVPVVVYAAMFGATVAGQVVGIAADALVLGRRWVWVPFACSVVLEAVVGARFAAARIGRLLTWGECARVSSYYSMGLAAVSAPLAVWTLASNRLLRGSASSREVVVAVGVALSVLVGATVVRQAMMTVLSASRPRFVHGPRNPWRKRASHRLPLQESAEAHAEKRATPP